MTHNEYWIEAVWTALEEMEIDYKLSKDDIKDLGEAMAVSADMQSQAFGWDAIPNPQNTETTELKEKLKREEKEHEQIRDKYFQELCRKANVRPVDVWFNERDGILEYRR